MSISSLMKNIRVENIVDSKESVEIIHSKELLNSVKELSGLVTPMIVRRTSETSYVVVHGNLQLIREARLSHINVIVLEDYDFGSMRFPASSETLEAIQCQMGVPSDSTQLLNAKVDYKVEQLLAENEILKRESEAKAQPKNAIILISQLSLPGWEKKLTPLQKEIGAILLKTGGQSLAPPVCKRTSNDSDGYILLEGENVAFAAKYAEKEFGLEQLNVLLPEVDFFHQGSDSDLTKLFMEMAYLLSTNELVGDLQELEAENKKLTTDLSNCYELKERLAQVPEANETLLSELRSIMEVNKEHKHLGWQLLTECVARVPGTNAQVLEAVAVKSTPSLIDYVGKVVLSSQQTACRFDFSLPANEEDNAIDNVCWELAMDYVEWEWWIQPHETKEDVDPTQIPYQGQIKTDVAGSEEYFDFVVPVGSTDKEIEQIAKQEAFNTLDVSWERVERVQTINVDEINQHFGFDLNDAVQSPQDVFIEKIDGFLDTINSLKEDAEQEDHRVILPTVKELREFDAVESHGCNEHHLFSICTDKRDEGLKTTDIAKYLFDVLKIGRLDTKKQEFVPLSGRTISSFLNSLTPLQERNR